MAPRVDLKIQAVVHFRNELPFQVKVDWKNGTSCSHLSLGGNSSSQHPVPLTYQTYFNVTDHKDVLCYIRPKDLLDGSNYTLTIFEETETSNVQCLFSSDDPHWAPILTALGLGLCLVMVIYLIGLLCNRWVDRPRVTSEIVHDITSSSESGIGLDADASDVTMDIRISARRRVASLDALRGLVVVLMVFVNYDGGGYSFFECSSCVSREDEDGGLTIADVIAPAFAFILGFGIVLSIKTQLMLNEGTFSIVFKVVKRSLQLAIIGFLLSTYDKEYGEFFQNVTTDLLRLSLALFVVSLTHLTTIILSIKLQFLTGFRSLVVFLPESMVHLVVLVIHLVNWLDIPKGEDICTLEVPSGDDLCSHEMFPQLAFGYTGSILMAQVGLICGRIFLPSRSYYRRMGLLTTVGVTCAIVATISSPLPQFIVSSAIHRTAWSIPFIFGTSAFIIAAFVLFYMTIEVLDAWTNGFPLHYPGRNALLIYIGHKVLRPYFPFNYKLPPDAGHNELLTRSLVVSNLWLFISAYFYYQEQFFTLSDINN